MKQTKSVIQPLRLNWLAALVLSAALVRTGSLAAERNPFAQAARESYTGRFHGEGVELRLKPEQGKWKGSVVFKNKEYTLDAEQNPNGLHGQFADGDQTWPFTALAEGDKLTFNAGSFTALLQRRTLPRMEGRWRSPRVLIIFDSAAATLAGRIQFSGQEYSFVAEESAGDVEGVFEAGTESFPFRIVNEARGVVFHTGTFAEVITPLPGKSTLRVQTRPPVQFSLFNNGQLMPGPDGPLEFNGEQSLNLEVRAKGFEPCRTNLTLPAYTDWTWTAELEKPPYPTPALSRWTNSLGMIFVTVPGLKVAFGIWTTRVQDYALFADTAAGVDGSWRKVEFQKLRVSGGPDHPVTMVSWEDAGRFCRWLTETEQKARVISPEQFYRLPTDAEWSKAVGLDREPGARPRDKHMKIKGVYPWGKQWPPPGGAGNFADRTARSCFKGFGAIGRFDDGFATTSPVGSFRPNRYGLYDMAGNGWQWCDDWFDAERKVHVLRGGSWRAYDSDQLLSSHRAIASESRDDAAGFRCVLVVGN